MLKPVRLAVQQGFTLFEIMVVMVIVALLAGAASIVVSGNQESRMLENEARKLVALMDLTQEEANFQNIEIVKRLEPEGYAFLGIDEASLKWITFRQDFLQPVNFPDWMELDFGGISREFELKKQEQQKADFYPQILFFSSGESTAFKLVLRHRANSDLEYTVQSDGLNGILLVEPDDD